MINQVIIAGRLIEDPQVEGRGCALRLELARPARGSSGGEEAPATVRAVANDERRAANLQRYLRKGRDVLIHGHLQQDAGGLCVAVDSFEFMEDGLRTHLVVGALTARAGGSPAALTRPAVAAPMTAKSGAPTTAPKPAAKPARTAAAA